MVADRHRPIPGRGLGSLWRSCPLTGPGGPVGWGAKTVIPGVARGLVSGREVGRRRYGGFSGVYEDAAFCFPEPTPWPSP